MSRRDSRHALSSRKTLHVGAEEEYRKRAVCGRRLRVALMIALVLLLTAPALTLGQPPVRRPFRVGVLHPAFIPLE